MPHELRRMQAWTSGKRRHCVVGGITIVVSRVHGEELPISVAAAQAEIARLLLTAPNSRVDRIDRAVEALATRIIIVIPRHREKWQRKPGLAAQTCDHAADIRLALVGSPGIIDVAQMDDRVG